MNELLNELLTLIDQNVIRIQPYTLEDTERASIQARIDDWTRRVRESHPDLTRKAFQAIACLGGNLPDEHLTDRTGPNDAAHRGLMYCTARELARAALNGTLAELLKMPTDPKHCYLCDRPKLDCACVVEDFA